MKQSAVIGFVAFLSFGLGAALAPTGRAAADDAGHIMERIARALERSAGAEAEQAKHLDDIADRLRDCRR